MYHSPKDLGLGPKFQSIFFALRPAVVEQIPQNNIEHSKVKGNRICVTSLPNFSPFRSTASRFLVKKMVKVQHLKFHNSLSSFGRDPLYRSIHEFLGVNLVSTLRRGRESRLKFSPPIWSHGNENNKK